MRPNSIGELVKMGYGLRINCTVRDCSGSEILQLEDICVRRGADFQIESRLHLWRCPDCMKRGQGKPYLMVLRRPS